MPTVLFHRPHRLSAQQQRRTPVGRRIALARPGRAGEHAVPVCVAHREGWEFDVYVRGGFTNGRSYL